MDIVVELGSFPFFTKQTII